jgi:hypothetical protein
MIQKVEVGAIDSSQVVERRVRCVRVRVQVVEDNPVCGLLRVVANENDEDANYIRFLWGEALQERGVIHEAQVQLNVHEDVATPANVYVPLCENARTHKSEKK